MDPDRWERLQSLFHQAAERPPAGRRAWLAARCADDPTLLAEVERMLEADARPDPVLDRQLGEIASRMLEAGDASALPPDFGPYRLLGLLGEGGMGAVFLAERPDLRSRVAIKFLRDGWLSPARRQRFAAEQRTLARLNHPGIARLYDAGTLPDGTPWIAMEYVDGVPLTRHCAEHADSVESLLVTFREVCEAVLHAHQHAVLHRDLKPSNILVTPAGRVKLLDFGIARSLEPADADASRTRTGEWPMTPAYAAPEQLRGEALGVQSDLYSLGVILYELLTGRPPFDVADRTPGEVERILSERTPERPSVAARGPRPAAGAGAAGAAGETAPARRWAGPGRAAWADLDVLCLTAMQRDPARRYRTVDSLIRDLDRFLRGEPLEARPDSLGYRLGKYARRHWRPLAAAGAALALVIAMTAFYTVRLRTARNEALAEAERTRRIQTFMTGLFEGGDEAAGPSDTLRVLTLVARGEQEARALTGEPAIQAELYQTLGGIYHKRGAFDRADTLLTAALAMRRAALGPRHPDVARGQVALGLLRADQSRLEEAERMVREALESIRVGPRAGGADEARAMRSLGQVLGMRGSFDQAIDVLRATARLDSSAGLPVADRVATLTDLANSHFYAGHYAASESLNREVLALDRALYGDHHPNVAADLVNLGSILQDMGQPAQAEGRFREALGIYRGWFGEEHFETAATLAMVGRVLIPQGRHREADSLIRRALAIRERVYGPDHPSVATTINELGLLAQKQGRLDEAEARFRRMLAIYRTAYHDRHYLISVALANLGGVRVDQRRYPEAERLFREAIRRYGDTLPADHLYVGIARIKLGRTLLLQRRHHEAERESRAGYAIVARLADPAAGWLQNARQDLVAEYGALGLPDSAARFRAELERHAPPEPSAGSPTAARR